MQRPTKESAAFGDSENIAIICGGKKNLYVIYRYCRSRSVESESTAHELMSAI